MTYIKGIQFDKSPNLDAFGRLRVSQVTTQYDQKQLHDANPLFIDQELIGTATSTHSTTLAESALTAPAVNDAVILQTKQRFNYQSGKSQLLFWTFNNFGEGTNIDIKVARSGTTHTTVKRSNWDDPLDGTGASGITHDFDNNTIIAVSFEWLGVGEIQFMIVIDGVLIPFHYLDYTSTTNVYMSSPNQPMRWECRNGFNRVGYFSTNTTTPFNSTLDGFWLESSDSADALNVICASVNTEGAINQIGKILSANAGTNDLQFNSAGTTYAGIGIRLKSTHLDAVLDIIGFDYLAETNDRALWELRLNPTVTGTFAYTGVTNSAVEVAVGNQTPGASPTVSGGTVLDSGYVQQQGSIREAIESAIKLGAQIDGTVDEIVLCVTPISAGLDAYVSYSWRELS